MTQTSESGMAKTKESESEILDPSIYIILYLIYR
jgi:hypothetical protein